MVRDMQSLREKDREPLVVRNKEGKITAMEGEATPRRGERNKGQTAFIDGLTSFMYDKVVFPMIGAQVSTEQMTKPYDFKTEKTAAPIPTESVDDSNTSDYYTTSKFD